MNEPQAYLNGRLLPASQAAVPVSDGGFVQGTTVAEQLRTFGGKLFRLEAHLERLAHSLSIVGVEPGLNHAELTRVALALAANNHALLPSGHDLGLVIFVTPGPYAPMVAAGESGATIGMHTFPLRFALWAAKYSTGESLATTDVAQVAVRSWPPELKCRSRMHYYLADRQAHARHPGSRALMLDETGHVTETTTSNVVAYRQSEGLSTPPRHKILPGISLAVLAELAGKLQIPLVERDLKPDDLLTADEVFVTGTSSCILPVVRLNGQPIGAGKPGLMFARLLAAWNGLVGLDVAEQAGEFTNR